MKQFFLKVFTWWNGQTFGTQLWTWRFGELVGEDEQGNRYFRTKGAQDRPVAGFRAALGGLQRLRRGHPRSAVLAWLAASHRRRRADRGDLYAARMGKAACAEHDGDTRRLPAARFTLASGRRPKATGDYQPWTPGSLLSFNPRISERRRTGVIPTPVNNGNSGDIFQRVLEFDRRRWLNLTILWSGRPSRRFGQQFATAPICSGCRSGYGREIGPRCRFLKSPVNVELP